ncbi:chondroitin sulfate proteoglycan 5 isoform X2 [Panthera leo]|uniref:chondroitin sulfate proteoglycan 5 isoform X2 n=1 Tax=Panthera leo TaxID=9689 RepID=UPI001C6A37E5|nr:chondroitin sulfate proteoglycan 5 isoform X2 [Panthera leo]
MGRAGGGGPGRGPPPLLLLLGAALVLATRAAPAREAGSAVEAHEQVKSILAREPTANETREKAGPPAAEEDKTSWTAPGGEQAMMGPSVGPEEVLEASAAVTGAPWLEADSPGLGGVTAEAGSGDTQALPATLPAPKEALGQSSMAPSIPKATEASRPPSPTPGDMLSPGPEHPKESPLEVWLNLGGSTHDPHGPEPTFPFQGTMEPQPASDIIDIDYFEGLDGEGRGADLESFPGSPGTSEHHPDTGGETPSWSLLDLYDDFTPFDESDFYPTTSFYDDLDEEEEEEEDDKEAAGGGDLEDESDLLVPTEKPGLGPGTGQPTSRWHAVPPQHTLGMVPGSSIALRPRPGEPGRDLTPSENGTECRSGFVRHNGSCRSVCDLFPSYCHNGGQCYLVENIGAFCRRLPSPQLQTAACLCLRRPGPLQGNDRSYSRTSPEQQVSRIFFPRPPQTHSLPGLQRVQHTGLHLAQGDALRVHHHRLPGDVRGRRLGRPCTAPALHDDSVLRQEAISAQDREYQAA